MRHVMIGGNAEAADRQIGTRTHTDVATTVADKVSHRSKTSVTQRLLLGAATSAGKEDRVVISTP